MLTQYEEFNDSPTRRPPSLSESYAHNPGNIQRASSFQIRNDLELNSDKHLTVERVDIPNIQESLQWTMYITLLLRFVCHIALISMFETVFFFSYVSKLEDSGITNVLSNLVQTMTQSCGNLTAIERSYIERYIVPYINVSNLLEQSDNMLQIRQAHNHILYIRSWIYVGFISLLFVLGIVGSYLRSMTMNIGAILLENIGFVLMLAIYEYMFFTTIVLSYSSISEQEVLGNAVLEVEHVCKLLER